jgi:DNA-binding NarL/FixJ family response regulator
MNISQTEIRAIAAEIAVELARIQHETRAQFLADPPQQRRSTRRIIARQLRADGLTVEAIAGKLNCSTLTIWRDLKNS